jgi:hypothetical protein
MFFKRVGLKKGNFTCSVIIIIEQDSNIHIYIKYHAVLAHHKVKQP